MVPTTGTCRAVVLHGRRWRVAAVAAGAVAVGLVSIVGWRKLSGSMSPLVTAAAKASTRPVEGRLSGGFAHKSWSPSPLPERHHEIVAAAAAISLGESPSARLHSLGVTRLLFGAWNEAVDALQLAVDPRAEHIGVGAIIEGSRDHALLGDLAVALLARGTGERRPQDLVWAAEAAQAAWAIRKTPETAWNRAVTIEALKLRRPAIAAWRDVLDNDMSDGWSDEARERMRRLKAPTASDEWQRLRETLDKDPEMLKRAAREFPQQSRELVEELLAANDSSSFDLARRLATAVANTSGESLASGSIAATDAAPETVRETFRAGFREYAAGKSLLRSQRMHEAISMLASASGKLTGNLFRMRAELYRATAEYYLTEFEVARDRLHFILADRAAIAASPSLEGQAYWVLGLIYGVSGEWNEALSAYEFALRAFDRAGEHENRVAIHGLMAETLTLIGAKAEAWPHRAAAMNDLFVLGTSRRMQNHLYEAGTAAEHAGAKRVGLLYASEFVAHAERTRDPVSIAYALITRAPAAAAAGNSSLADNDLRSARALIPSITDPVMRRKSEMNLRVAEVRVLRRHDPRAAWRAAAVAIDRFRRTREDARLPELHYERALAARELRWPEAVLAEVRQGIVATEQQRLALEQTERRRAFHDRWSPLFALAVSTLSETGQHERAFQYAEQSRGRSFVQDPTVLRYTTVSRQLPSNSAVVEYAVTDDFLLVWVITANSVAIHRTGATRQRLEWLVSRIHDAVQANDVTQFDRAVEAVYRAVVEPVRPYLPERLIIIPDGVLHSVPFAALRGATTSRQLVQDHEITIGPSAAAIFGHGRRAPAAGGKSIAIIGNTAPAGADLAALPSARRELQSLTDLYPEAELLFDRDATKRSVLAALRRSSTAHLAGHAITDSDAAAAALVLSAATENRESAFLYPTEIERCRLDNVQLLVLAGCATGSGAQSTDGPSSLGRAFLIAGVESVVVTYWSVDDSETEPLMVDFHRRLRRGDRPASALRAAQITALTSRPRRSVFAWPAFHLISVRLEGGEHD